MGLNVAFRKHVMTGFLAQAFVYLTASVVAVSLSARLGLGSVLGYLGAGILIGPVLGLVGSETQELQHFAEFGVVMMLFVIGLELTPRTLWNMRQKILGLGLAQILGSMALITWAAIQFGLPQQQALAIGMILSLSSTAIVLQTLNEKRLIATKGGRSVFSVLLTQDIAVIPMLAFLPFLVVHGVQFGPDGAVVRSAVDGLDAAHGGNLLDSLPPWAAAMATLAAIAGIILAGIYLVRPVFRFIQKADLPEMFTAFALLIVVGISFAMQSVGISPALGSFLAGVVLANTEFRHELETDIAPFKGLLLGLFFITVGAGINFAALWARPFTLLGLTLLLVAFKGAVLYLIARLARMDRRDRWLFTLSLAQAGEFGFVLLALAAQQAVLPVWLGERMLLVVTLSMLITPMLFILYEHLMRRSGPQTHTPEDDIHEDAPVIIVGSGRFGQVVARVVRSAGFKAVVLDKDIKTIQLMRRLGIESYFGDPSSPDRLRAAGIEHARVLVVAIDAPAHTVKIIQAARRICPDIHIVARARDRQHVFELYNAGANDIVREMFDSSLRAGRYVLENIGLTEFEASEAEKMFYAQDRRILKEGAKHWRPDVPLHENKDFLAHVHEKEQDLVAALMDMLDQNASKDDDGSKPANASNPGDG